MFFEAPGEGILTCRSKGTNGEFVERTYDYVFASLSLQEKIKNKDVVEAFESRPHKAVIFLVERDKEFQVWREQKNAQGTTRIRWRKAARTKHG